MGKNIKRKHNADFKAKVCLEALKKLQNILGYLVSFLY